jgi:hypothetical protein
MRKLALVEAPAAFFKRLGRQTGMLKTLNLYLSDSSYADEFPAGDFFNDIYGWWLDVIEITSILHAVWGLEQQVDISFTVSSPSRWNGHFDTVTVNETMRSFLRGQLICKQHIKLISAVTIKATGSGGMIGWSKVRKPGDRIRGCRHRDNMKPRSYPDPDMVVNFESTDGGKQLKLITKTGRLSLQGLPNHLRSRIFEAVFRPLDGFVINVDQTTKFDIGLFHVNKEIYKNWLDAFLYENLFVVEMAATE